MAEKQTKTVKRKPQVAKCELNGETYELLAVTYGTATICRDDIRYFVRADAITPTNKAAKDMISGA